MKIFIKGKQAVTLSQREFVAKGGEGLIYRQGDTCYKLYEPPNQCIPEAKISELSVLQLRNIIIPQNLILDNKNHPIGYTSRWVDNAESLCKLFTEAYKTTNHLTYDQINALLHHLQDIVAYIHSKNIIVVDLNELNFLVKVPEYKEIYAIDVNSYQTPSFPATVIMPNIKDWHTSGFNENSDWFSFAVLSFNLMIGMHPYKGGHPDFVHIPIKERMIARMHKNISAFNSKATMPKVCESFDVIPPGLKKWLYSVLEEGKRIPPPTDYEAVAVIIQIKEIVGSNLFEIKLLETLTCNIFDCCYSNSQQIIVVDKGLYINKQFRSFSNTLQVGFSPKMNWPCGVYLSQDTIHIVDLRSWQETTLGHAKSIFSSGNRLYTITGNDVLEIVLTEIGDRILPSLKNVGRVLDVPDATKVYDGVVVQQVLDRYVVSVFPESGKCYQINIPELDGYRILTGKYENNVLMLIGEQKGKYTRFVIRFGPDFASYDIRLVQDVDYTGLNFTVTDASVCVTINEEEKVELFSNKKDSSLKIIEDAAIDGTMHLFHNGSKVIFAKKDKLYSMSMIK